MDSFVITGEQPLHGEIPVRGAKNTSDKCLAACLLTEEDCIIDNLPEIDDVKNLLKIFTEMGADVEYLEKRKVRVCAKNLDPMKINQDLVAKIRMSVLLLGALVGRFKEVKLAPPGGDKIGARQITTHLEGLKTLGIDVKEEKGTYILKADKMVGTKVVLDEFSPTATVNLLLASCLASGRTVIKNVAAEPHIDNVMEMLNNMGARVQWAGNHLIEVEGVEKLHGTEHTINPDYLEMWTFMVLATCTKSELAIHPFVEDYLDLELTHMRRMGGNFAIKDNVCTVKPTTKLKAPVTKIHSMPYPGFAADNLPPFVVLATQAEGTTLIQEWMYEGRQKYVNDLVKMGADATSLDPHRVMVKGPTPLYGKETTSYDIRAGATMIIAALTAQGKSKVTEVDLVDRGYEKIEKRLQACGAKIERIKE